MTVIEKQGGDCEGYEHKDNDVDSNTAPSHNSFAGIHVSESNNGEGILDREIPTYILIAFNSGREKNTRLTTIYFGELELCCLESVFSP